MTPKLKRVPARFGCMGCYYDEHEGCDVDLYIEARGLPFPSPSLWDCGDEKNSYIFVIDEDNDEQ